YQLLEVLPRAPRIESVAALIGQVTIRTLPPLNDASWMLQARRALIERLIEQLAGRGGAAGVDRLAEMLGAAYQIKEPDGGAAGGARAGRAGGEQAAAEAPAGPSTAGVEDLWRSMLADAEALVPNRAAPIPLAVVQGRRNGRRALASGPVQIWAAEQVSVAEL